MEETNLNGMGMVRLTTGMPLGRMRERLAAQLPAMIDDALRTSMEIMDKAERELAAGSLWQASEKAFAAWKAALHLAVLAALKESPARGLNELIRALAARGVAAVVGGVLTVSATTSNAPKVARQLCEGGVRPACTLREVKDYAYRLHYYFYEGDFGAAGFEGEEEVADAVKRVLGAVKEAVEDILKDLGMQRNTWDLSTA